MVRLHDRAVIYVKAYRTYRQHDPAGVGDDHLARAERPAADGHADKARIVQIPQDHLTDFLLNRAAEAFGSS